MKKLIFGMFLLGGTTFGFANTANNTITSASNTAFEKLINVKVINIDSVVYDDNGKCTVKVSYDNGTTSGTITATAATCSQAMATITNMLGQAGL